MRLLYRCICAAWGKGTNINWGLSKDSLRCIGHLWVDILLIDKPGRGYVANGGADGLLDFESELLNRTVSNWLWSIEDRRFLFDSV